MLSIHACKCYVHYSINFFSLKTVFFCKVHVILKSYPFTVCMHENSLSIQLFKPPVIQLVMSLPEHPGDCLLPCEGQAGIG